MLASRFEYQPGLPPVRFGSRRRGRVSSSLPGLSMTQASLSASCRCAGEASRRRRRRGSCSGRRRWPLEDAVGVVPVLFERSRPCKRRPACRRRRSPPRRGPGSRRCCSDAQRTSAPRASSVSMSTAVWIVMWSEPAMRAPSQRLLRRVLLADRHQRRHLRLGDGDFLAPPGGKSEVGDVEVRRGGHGCSHGLGSSWFCGNKKAPHRSGCERRWFR